MAVGALFPHILGAWRNYFSEKYIILFKTTNRNVHKLSDLTTK